MSESKNAKLAREFVEKRLGCDDIHGLERPLTALLDRVKAEERKSYRNQIGIAYDNGIAVGEANVKSVPEEERAAKFEKSQDLF